MTEWNVLMAGTVFVLMPVIIVFIFAQRYIIEGVAHTGLKG
jgi:multiple sugar transport system permease protein